MIAGVLLIDKPSGMTSHDVVAILRRKLGTRRVGHAGTLDPMATGLLVVLLGQGTKLEPHLSSADKSYQASVALGRATRTLDADGETSACAPLPPLALAEMAELARDPSSAAPTVRRALQTERERRMQVPPVFSAIHVDGVRSHARARAGEIVVLPPRAVEVKSLELSCARLGPEPQLDVELRVAKGYYVRSFARDLGETLGCPAHLSRLRRLTSGRFSVSDALALDAPATELASRVIPLVTAACLHLPVARLSADDEARARCGKTLPPAIMGPNEAPLATGARLALTNASGQELVAIGQREGDHVVVIRGFAAAAG